MTDLHNETGRADLEFDAPESTLERSGNLEATTEVQSAMQNGSRVPTYIQAGYELIPLHVPDALDKKGRSIGKAPLGTNWRQAPPLTAAAAVAHTLAGGNVGVRLRAEDLVIDVDPRNFKEGDDPLARLEKDLGYDLRAHCPTVVTGSDGLHLYLRKPAEASLRETLEDYQGVEFKTLGRQVVAAGSVHPATGKLYHFDPLADDLSATPAAPPSLLAALEKPARTTAVDAGGCTPEQLGEMLAGLDAELYQDHTKWLDLMMACHHATAGEGRDEFIEWSTSDPQFADHGWTIGRRWDSLHADGGRRVTEKTLFKELVKAGKGHLVDAVNRSPAEEDFPHDEPDLGSIPARSPSPGAGHFQMNRGRIEPTYRNTRTAVELGRFEPGFDVLAQMPMLRAKHLPWEVDVGREINDDLLRIVREWIMEQWGFEPSRENVSEVLKAQATKHPFSPVVEYLDGLAWDGVPRLDSLFPAYLGAEDGPYERAVGRKFMLAAVRRARKPGTKFDTVPIIEGKQGVGKTSALRILGGAWHSDAELGRVDGKDAAGVLHGVWIMELGELTAMNKAEVDSLKAFVSRCEDRYRPAYGAFFKTFARRCVFVGTTNSSQYLRDLTGNRRYLPVEAGQVDLEGLRRDRDQLWAEASVQEATGESLVVPQELWATAADRQGDRLIADPWLDPIRAFVANKTRVSSRAIFEEVLLQPLSRSSQAEARRVAGLMASLGFSHKKGMRIDGQVMSGYERD